MVRVSVYPVYPNMCVIVFMSDSRHWSGSPQRAEGAKSPQYYIGLYAIVSLLRIYIELACLIDIALQITAIGRQSPWSLDKISNQLFRSRGDHSTVVCFV